MSGLQSNVLGANRYEIAETTHGFEVLRDGEHTWELGHVWTTRGQAERDVLCLIGDAPGLAS